MTSWWQLLLIFALIGMVLGYVATWVLGQGTYGWRGYCTAGILGAVALGLAVTFIGFGEVWGGVAACLGAIIAIAVVYVITPRNRLQNRRSNSSHP